MDIREKVEEVSDGYLFKTRNAFLFKNDITITKSKDYPECTDLRIVYYEVGKYNLKVSKTFIEEAHKISGYVKDVFNNHTPKIGVEVVVPFGNSGLDYSVDRVIDSMRGFYARSKQLSNVDRFRIGLLIGVIFLTLLLFLIGQPLYAIITIAIEILIAVMSLPEIYRKQRG